MFIEEHADMKFFNLIPEEMKKSGYRALNRQLTAWLRARPFYPLNEFLDWKNKELLPSFAISDSFC